MKPTETTAKPAATPKAGLLALLCGSLGVQGSGARKIRQGSGAPVSLSVLGVVMAVISASAVGATVVPAAASAYATIEGPPKFSAAPGLPDGRVYEQVSPADKNGNEAGATSHSVETSGAEQRYGFAAADGDAVLFEGTGPMGEVASALNNDFVATKNKGSSGWTTRAITPNPQQVHGALSKLVYVDPSADLSHVMVETPPGETLAVLPNEECGNQIYLSDLDPFVPATWLERPTIDDAIENCTSAAEAGAPVGGTSDFSTVYFTFPGTLLLEDASRAPHAGSGEAVEAWGFYEDREGALREAGVLPADSPYPGKPSPFGAVPAASVHGRATAGNQISTQESPGGVAAGERAFFVSPDPASCEPQGHNNCAVDPPELYVRENGARTILVSQSQLPGKVGEPAPGGVFPMPNPTYEAYSGVSRFSQSYVFASPDGSQAFFQSEAALTKPAEEASTGTEPKTYDFDVETGALTYLPNVGGKIQIVATETEGSSFVFVRPEAGGAPAELDLWSGPGEGHVTSITQLPGGSAETARISSGGSVVVFTAAGLPGFNDAGTAEIFRYDVPANTLGCVSCPPHGVTPTGNAQMSSLHAGEEANAKHFQIRGVVEGRGMSADGSRIFFDTPDPLVPQDTNTNTYFVNGEDESEKQGRDVYEWENGVVYLISSGKSPLNSYFLDNSENGDDVFFATAEDLVPSDTDGAYDVYDARVPHPGDNPPPAAVPCEGSVCQGPPHVQSPLATPPRATLPGSDNLTPEPTVTSSPAKKTTTKTVRCKKNYIKKKSKCVRRKRAKKSKRGSK